MQKPQSKFLKIVSVIIILSFSCLDQVSAQGNLQAADSLYSKKKYVEAYSIYDSLYKEGFYSPAMLLKMARIQEGMEDEASSLYFLEKYYWETKDEKVLKQLDEVSEKLALEGYKYDLEFYFNFYLLKFYWYIIIALILGTVVLLLLAYLKKSKNLNITAIVLLLLSALALNYPLKDYAILNGRLNYLMEGPSAASDVIEVVPKGTKIRFNPHNETWVKMDWNDETVYLRADKVKKL